MTRVQICVGMIASGKSTYAQKKAKHGAVILNDDSIVNAVHGNNYSLYEKELKPLYKGIGYSIMSHAISLGRDVIVDRTNLKKSTRKRYISAAHSMDVDVDAVVFPMNDPEVHAKRRVKSDDRGLGYEKWLEVAKEHRETYVPVSEDEGFEYIIQFSNDDITDMFIRENMK